MARGGNKTDALLIAALATGATHEQAAAAANVSLRTVARRMADPAFRRSVDAEQVAIIERFTGGAASKLGATLNRLEQLVDSKSDVVALGACRAMIDAVIRVREHATLTREVAELRASIHESAVGGGAPPQDRGESPSEPVSHGNAHGTQGGPGRNHEGCGPVASSVTAEPLGSVPTPGFPTGWEV
ncbi:hypothetical protein [Gemmata palustris]|uniref:hypothetical protein n=1 Tax=Gemmata palustris TaxID=2822762 RepID=UPI001FEB746F|nr:hypothetical protein [Gemmata palustris]